MIEQIRFRNKDYPLIQSEGFASQYSFPLALKFCKGVGFDIGCMKREWSLPGSIPIDLVLEDGNDAFNLPIYDVDYIYSSHCLEHLPNYIAALYYWHETLKKGGNLFLYLPNMDYQVYWRPHNNRKHLHYINPAIIRSYFDGNDMWRNVHVTDGYDLNGSFYVIAEKI